MRNGPGRTWSVLGFQDRGGTSTGTSSILAGASSGNRQATLALGVQGSQDRLLEKGYGADESFSEEKLDYAIWIMHTLSKCYGVPEYFDDWATRLAAREKLGAGLGLGDHWGLVHQFQQRGDHQSVRTKNGLVDWWLFLIPHGVDFRALTAYRLMPCLDAWMPMDPRSEKWFVCAMSRSLPEV